MTPFIIDSIKRNEILDNCTTEEERQKLRRLYDRFFVAGMFVDTDMSGVICG